MFSKKLENEFFLHMTEVRTCSLPFCAMIMLDFKSHRTTGMEEIESTRRLNGDDHNIDLSLPVQITGACV